MINRRQVLEIWSMIGDVYISACAWYNTKNCYWIMSPKLWDLLYENKLVEVNKVTSDKEMKGWIVHIDPSVEGDYYVALMNAVPEMIKCSLL